MIHDLSIDGIFRKNEHDSTPFVLPMIPDMDPGDDRAEDYEALLTGDADERDLKRFFIDYQTDQCMCDRCGATILKKSWTFTESKLCVRCEEELEKEFSAPYSKAWDLPPETDGMKPTENVFLWD